MFACKFPNSRRLRNNNEIMRTKYIDQCLAIQEKKHQKEMAPPLLSLTLTVSQEKI